MSMYTDIHQKEKKYQTTIPRPRDEVKQRSPRACIILSSTGLEPKEVHEPWEYLTNHGFFVEFATWDGQPAKADPTLLDHTLWGSSYALQSKWKEFVTLDDWLRPRAWAPPSSSNTSLPSSPASPKQSTSAMVTEESVNRALQRPNEGQKEVSHETEVVQESSRWSLDSYDLVLIPGGWATRVHLEKDTVLHALLTAYCLHLPKRLGAKVLAVVGDGISPLLHVRDPLTQEPLLKGLTSTGPGYDSWTGLVTGRDLGSLVPPLVKRYVNKKVTIDPDNWYISSPSASFNAEFCPALVTFVKGAVRVSELREVERNNKNAKGANSKRLSTAQTHQLQGALEFDGLSKRQRERLNVDGIGKAESGFVMTNWSWGWRKNYN